MRRGSSGVGIGQSMLARRAYSPSETPPNGHPLSNRGENDEHPRTGRGCSSDKFGDDLLSQGVYPQVPSALAVLTSVFGMGTGVTLPVWSPKSVVKDGPTRTSKYSRASTSDVQTKPSAD